MKTTQNTTSWPTSTSLTWRITVTTRLSASPVSQHQVIRLTQLVQDYQPSCPTEKEVNQLMEELFQTVRPGSSHSAPRCHGDHANMSLPSVKRGPCWTGSGG